MKKKHTRRQHYVPEFLLRQFTFNGSDAYVLDKENKNKIYISDVRNLCFKKDLYEQKWENSRKELGKYVLDNQIEERFANLEYIVSPIFREIIGQVRSGTSIIVLSDKERESISEFTATLYLRHPYVMNTILEYYEGVENKGEVKKLLEIISYLFDKMDFGSSKSLFEYSKKAGIFNKDIEYSPLYVELERIMRKSFVFWYSIDADFVTASFPFYVSYLYDRSYQRIVLPISYDVAIVFFDEMPYPLSQGLVLKPEKKNVEEDMKCYVQEYSEKLARFFLARNEERLKQLLQ